MDFNLVSKNNLGVVTALLLVIILSQGRFFNFLLDTALGRAILILFILFISYTNKILGVVSVLFIIIMFNNSNIGYMEGFEEVATHTATTNNANKKPASHRAPEHRAPEHHPEHHDEKPKKREHFDNTTTVAMKKHVEGGSEGYNNLEIERSFGKKSGSIPAAKTTSSEGFQPFSGSYNQQYSQF